MRRFFEFWKQHWSYFRFVVDRKNLMVRTVGVGWQTIICIRRSAFVALDLRHAGDVPLPAYAKSAEILFNPFVNVQSL